MMAVLKIIKKLFTSKFSRNVTTLSFTPNIRGKLVVSRPVIPRLCCLPKILKPVRLTVSAIGSATYNLSKWLSVVFVALPIQQERFSLKNLLQFIQQVTNNVSVKEINKLSNKYKKSSTDETTLHARTISEKKKCCHSI